MVSSRYVFPVIFLLMLALVPTILHTYLSPVDDDGLSVHTIAPILSDYSSKPFLRHNNYWAKTMYGSQDWVERIYKNPRGKKVRLFSARSYDYKRLYHHPELALSHGVDLEDEGIIILPGASEIPVHVLRNTKNNARVAYVLLYENEFITNPVLFQFTQALKQIISTRKAMTLFYVSDSPSSASAEYSQSPSAFVLSAAIKSFMAQKAD